MFKFPYEPCGRPVAPEKVAHSILLATSFQTNSPNFAVEVVVEFEDGGRTMLQSYLARCLNQRIVYDKDDLPRRIDVALEESDLIFLSQFPFFFQVDARASQN